MSVVTSEILKVFYLGIHFFLGQIDCTKEKKFLIISWVFKTQFKMSFLTPFTAGKKMLGKTPNSEIEYIYI